MGGWLEKLEIRLNSASIEVKVEVKVEAKIGNFGGESGFLGFGLLLATITTIHSNENKQVRYNYFIQLY